VPWRSAWWTGGAARRAGAGLNAGVFQVVELVGEPGMGKTALLTELRIAAAARRARVAAGKATEFERLPFAMFSDAFATPGRTC